MHFKAMPITSKPRTPKQNAQESQAPIKALITITTTDATATTTTTIITKKAKGRALPLERWH
jgi:hypothetical protein